MAALPGHHRRRRPHTGHANQRQRLRDGPGRIPPPPDACGRVAGPPHTRGARREGGGGAQHLLHARTAHLLCALPHESATALLCHAGLCAALEGGHPPASARVSHGGDDAAVHQIDGAPPAALRPPHRRVGGSGAAAASGGGGGGAGEGAADVSPLCATHISQGAATCLRGGGANRERGATPADAAAAAEGPAGGRASCRGCHADAAAEFNGECRLKGGDGGRRVAVPGPTGEAVRGGGREGCCCCVQPQQSPQRRLRRTGATARSKAAAQTPSRGCTPSSSSTAAAAEGDHTIPTAARYCGGCE